MTENGLILHTNVVKQPMLLLNQCSISIPLKHPKARDFLIFSTNIEKRH